MPITRTLLQGPITFSEARLKEENILHELTYVVLAANFRKHIEDNNATIKAIVAHHLRLSPTSCQIDISAPSEWLNGFFNLCVPVLVHARGQSTRFIIRFPLPYKTGESFRPGNGDEKIRCEAATYAWMSQECPSLPITCLRGFGLSTGQRFTNLKNTSIFTKCIHYIKRRIFSLLQYPIPCQYARDRTPSPNELGVGYLLLDYVEEGELLSQSYLEKIGDTTQKHNLFSDLAKIQLTLFQKPFPHIGSLTFDDNAVLQLTNRPLAVEVASLENQEIPIDMPRDRTYSTVESYARDLLLFHDNRLRFQPNGITSLKDGIGQLSALTTMRSICSEFFDRKLNHGPFVLTLTDMHTNNFFVDDDWHITKIIDLEWACVRPLEMQHPPYWLSNQSLDQMDEAEYGQMYHDYVDVFQQQEEKMIKQGLLQETENGLFYTDLLRRLWEKGTFWYCLALDSTSGLCHVFDNRLKPRYPVLDESSFDGRFYLVAPTFWCIDAWELIKTRVKDKEQYEEKLRHAFQEAHTED